MAYCTVCKSESAKPVFEKSGYSLVKCVFDGHMYISNPPSAAIVTEIYTTDYFTGSSPVGYHHNVFESKEKHTRKARRNLEMIMDFKSQRINDRLLDVGSGPGFFLKEASNYYDVKGIDVSKAAADYAKASLGVDVQVSKFEDYSPANGLFSVITMWSVLEHTLNPRENLIHANKIMQSGGLIAISYPNVNGISRLVKRKNWRGFQFPEHLHFFNRKNLSRLLRDTNFLPIPGKLKDSNFFNDTNYVLALKVDGRRNQ